MRLNVDYVLHPDSDPKAEHQDAFAAVQEHLAHAANLADLGVLECAQEGLQLDFRRAQAHRAHHHTEHGRVPHVPVDLRLRLLRTHHRAEAVRANVRVHVSGKRVILYFHS